VLSMYGQDTEACLFCPEGHGGQKAGAADQSRSSPDGTHGSDHFCSLHALCLFESASPSAPAIIDKAVLLRYEPWLLLRTFASRPEKPDWTPVA